MNVCTSCKSGNHQHDTYVIDGTDAGCPNVAPTPENPAAACDCPHRRQGSVLHRCDCGHVHERQNR